MSKAELIKAGVQPEFFKGYYDEQLAEPPRSSIVDPEKIKRSRKKINKAANAATGSHASGSGTELRARQQLGQEHQRLQQQQLQWWLLDVRTKQLYIY